MRPFRLALLAVLTLLALLVAALAVFWLWRPGLDDEAAHRLHAPVPAAASGEFMTATWFGTTAVLLRAGGHAIFIDPFFTRPEGWLNLLMNRAIAPDEALIRDWLIRAGVERLDGVLVSHSHYDHAMDAGVVARLTGARLVGSASTANVGRGAGLPEERILTIEPGAPVALGPFRVSFIESRHAGATGGKPLGDIETPLSPPARYLDYRQGGTWSILVEHPLGRVLHHGSAGYVPGALEGRRADVVFLGIALREDLGEYLGETVDAVGARRVIPVHWDDFTRGLHRPLRPLPFALRFDEFFAGMRARRPDLRVETLAIAEPVVLLPGR